MAEELGLVAFSTRVPVVGAVFRVAGRFLQLCNFWSVHMSMCKAGNIQVTVFCECGIMYALWLH